MSEPETQYRELSAADGNFEAYDQLSSNHGEHWDPCYVPGTAIEFWKINGIAYRARRPLKPGDKVEQSAETVIPPATPHGEPITEPLRVSLDPGTPFPDQHSETILAGPCDTSPSAVLDRAQHQDEIAAREVAAMMNLKESGEKAYNDRLRDEFAMHAIYEASQFIGGEREPSAISRRAYKIADAMIIERAPKQTEDPISF